MQRTEEELLGIFQGLLLKCLLVFGDNAWAEKVVELCQGDGEKVRKVLDAAFIDPRFIACAQALESVEREILSNQDLRQKHIESLLALRDTIDKQAKQRARVREETRYMLNLVPYPGRSASDGYSSQTWLAIKVNEYLHSGSYYCWFAGSLNSMTNGDDSNPIWLYLLIDRAVSQGGINNSKIKDIRANLMSAVDAELTAQGRTSEISAALAAIAKAPLDLFTPQIWRIKRGALGARCAKGLYYPDEFLVADLKPGEFTVIVP